MKNSNSLGNEGGKEKCSFRLKWLLIYFQIQIFFCLLATFSSRCTFSKAFWITNLNYQVSGNPFLVFCSEMSHHLLDSPVITTYDQLTNFLFLCIWKRIVKKLRIVFSDPKESEFQIILSSVYKLMNMLIILQTNNNKLQILYCNTWTTFLAYLSN